MTVHTINRYQRVIDEIGGLNWSALTREELMPACRAYYYFSVQFVGAVGIACKLYPSDRMLMALREGELDTDNLSPYPGIAKEGERMNHDEFMLRTVAMSSLEPAAKERAATLGRTYLTQVRRLAPLTRAMALSSYEDGGLEK